jgi:hypothetical protein
MKTEKLFFTEDAKVNKEIIYHKNKTYDVPVETGSAQRWITRGIAHSVSDKVEVKTIEVKVEVPKEEVIVVPEAPEEVVEQSTEEPIQEEVAVEEAPIEEVSSEVIAKEKPKKENKNKKNPGKGL